MILAKYQQNLLSLIEPVDIPIEIETENNISKQCDLEDSDNPLHNDRLGATENNATVKYATAREYDNSTR